MQIAIGYEDGNDINGVVGNNAAYYDRVVECAIDLARSIGFDKFSVIDVDEGGKKNYVPGSMSMPDGAPDMTLRLANIMAPILASLFHALGVKSVKVSYEDGDPYSVVFGENQDDIDRDRRLKNLDTSSIYETVAKLLPLEGRDYNLNIDLNPTMTSVRFSPTAMNQLGKRWCDFLRNNLSKCLGMSDDELDMYLAHDAVFDDAKDSGTINIDVPGEKSENKS